MKAVFSCSSIPVIVTTQNDGEADRGGCLILWCVTFCGQAVQAPDYTLHRVANFINLRETASMVNLMQYHLLTGLFGKEFFYQKTKNYSHE
ncbi:MAG: hypothetical protein QM793_02740 [Muricomes sp.]